MADTRASEVDEPMSMSWTAGRVIGVLVALVVALFWGWILTGGPKKANPDELTDRAWVDATIERCEVMLDGLDAIPSAAATANNVERAAFVREANEVVAVMVDTTAADPLATADEQEIVDKWIADWRIYLDDRALYADAVEEDPGAPFQITENEELGRGVDDTIRTFADVNDMPECRPPGDVG